MNDKKNWNKELFSFTRSEIRGLTVLIIIIIGLIIFRIYLKDSSQGDILLEHTVSAVHDTIFRKNIFGNDNHTINRKPNALATRRMNLQYFDPNQVTRQKLLDIGFNRFTARNIVKYRKNGGYFYRPSDLLKIYGIDSSFYSVISNYIIISTASHGKNPEPSHHKISVHHDLNKIDSADLLLFKGIGPVLASRIVKYRELLGGYISVNQLYEVYGLPDSIIAHIIPRLVIDTSGVKKINLNKAGFAELIKHPYLNSYQVKAILAFRKHAGYFREKKQLLDYYLLPDKVYLKVAPYLTLR